MFGNLLIRLTRLTIIAQPVCRCSCPGFYPCSVSTLNGLLYVPGAFDAGRFSHRVLPKNEAAIHKVKKIFVHIFHTLTRTAGPVGRKVNSQDGVLQVRVTKLRHFGSANLCDSDNRKGRKWLVRDWRGNFFSSSGKQLLPPNCSKLFYDASVCTFFFR